MNESYLESQNRAAELLKLYGTSSNDYFKLWPDKKYFFTSSGNGFVAHGLSHKVALVLGDPTTPEEEMEQSIDEFLAHCRQNKWKPIFHQVSANYVAIYKSLGFRPFKTSEDAIVDLQTFSIAGNEGKSFRSTLNRMAREGVHAQLFDAPIPEAIIGQAKEVSDSWLTLGKRERRFVLGSFEDDYVRNTPMLAAFNAGGKMQGFINIIPSYALNTATIDLMRHRADAPNGLMDFLFLKVFDYNKTQGFSYFSMGPTPIIKLQPNEAATVEEKVFYKLANYLDSYFGIRGLRNYKSKFATIWEPRYLMHRRVTDWPQVLKAFTDLTELEENKKPIFGKDRRRLYRQITAEVIADIRRVRKERRQAKRKKLDKDG